MAWSKEEQTAIQKFLDGGDVKLDGVSQYPEVYFIRKSTGEKFKRVVYGLVSEFKRNVKEEANERKRQKKAEEERQRVGHRFS